MHTIVSFIFVAVGVGAYLTPSMIAQRRMRREVSRILLVNLALGWTIAGWIGALSWATKSSGTDLRSAANAARRHCRLLKLERAKERC